MGQKGDSWAFQRIERSHESFEHFFSFQEASAAIRSTSGFRDEILNGRLRKSPTAKSEAIDATVQ